jgi:hypothetical protein
MPSYELQVGFSNNDLSTIYTVGANVIIAKPTSDGTPNVAWQVFRPMSANTVSWEENYGIYASTSEVQNGAQLSQLSSVKPPAAINKLYTLESNSIISGPASGGTSNAFSLHNTYDVKQYMTVGLYQDANVNGTDIIGNALSAAGVMLNHIAAMTPYTTVYIWLQSQVKSNCVVTNVTSPMTQITFGGGVSSNKVKYDSSTGTFIADGGNMVHNIRHALL